MTVREKIKKTVGGSGGRFILLAFPNGLLALSVAATTNVITDLILYRTCLVSMNMNETDCSLLRLNSTSPQAMELETSVEQYASMIVIAKDILTVILTTVASSILVAWSDRGGRRPVLLGACAAASLTYVALTLMCNWNISPWYLLLTMIPWRLSGGLLITRLASNCYISDMTTDKDRTMQMTLLEASNRTADMLGVLAGSAIFKKYGYAYTLGSATVCSMLAMVHTYYYLPESVKDSANKSVSTDDKISFLKKLFTSGGNFHRPLIWLAIFSLSLSRVIEKGHQSIDFLFTRSRLAWDVQKFSYYYAASTILTIIGLCLVSIRSQISGVSDTLLIFIGFLSALGGVVTKSLAWQSWHMYLALCIQLFSGITLPTMRSMISKFVPREDIGKFFSSIALLQILGTLGGSPLYTLVYSNYLPPIYPAPVHLVSASFYVLLIICSMCMKRVIRKFPKPPTDITAAPENLRSKSQTDIRQQAI